MAKGLNRPINVQANLSFDTLQAKAQLTSLKKDINKLTSDLSLTSSNGQLGITKELTQAVKMTSQLQSILRSSTNDITGNLDLTKFNDSLRRTGTTLKDYQTTLNALGDNGAKAFNNLNKAIIGAETPLLRTTAAAKETLNTLGNTVRWQATSSLIHGVMGTAQQAMNYVKKLDSSLNSIQIVTGKNAATMADFARQANEAAKSLSTTTNEYAKAALIYYQQGLSDQQVQGRVATTLKMANVSGQTAAKVSDQMTSIWNNFYNGSKSLEYYADVMTALGASTASSSKEIAQGLSKFSSIAQTTGLSYEYATSALATITAATRQSADTVGTSLKTLFSRLQGLSLGETLDDGTTLNKYSKALDTIGVNIKEANGELKSMDTILNEIGGKWQSLSKDTQVALSQTIGGVRNYTSLLTLMNNWDTFRTNLNTARTSEGTLQKQAEIYAESWEAASTRVRAASESIYKNLIDDTTFKAVTNQTADVLNLVGKATDAIGGFRGILLSTAGIASQLFGEEISTSLSNVGYNIKSVLGGQKEIQQLRQEALMNLLTPTSRTGTIMNAVETSLNKNLVNRISTYQSKVESGKIADWQTAAYSQILQKATEQDSKTLSAIDAATQISKESSRYSYSFQQLLTAMTKNISSPADRLTAEAFLQGSRGKKNGGQIAYQELESIAKTSAVLEELNTRYQAAIPAERGMAVSVSSMKSLVGTILQLGSGAKELNISFKDLVGDAKVAKSLNSIYNDLNKFIERNGTVTEENLKKYQRFFENKSYDNFGELLYDAIDSSSSGGQGYQNLLIELQDQLTNTFKMSADQVSTTMQTIETNTRAVGESALEQVLNVGASIESNAAIMDQLNSNTRKHMDLSSAITEEIALFTSSAAAYSTIVETLNTLTSKDGNITDKVVALSSSFATLKSALSAADTVFDDFNAKIDIFGKSTPFTVGGLTALSGAALGLYEIGSKAIQAYQDTTIEGQLKQMSENAVYAKEQANIATEAYDTLVSSQSAYNKLVKELYGLKPGTADFSSTLLSTNEAALAMVQRYGLTTTRGTYGEILFDSNELIQKTKSYEQQARDFQTNALISSQMYNLFDVYSSYERLMSTPIWDRERNVGVKSQELLDRITTAGQNLIDTIIPTSSYTSYFALDSNFVKETKQKAQELYDEILEKGLAGATNAVNRLEDLGIWTDNTDVARAALKGIKDNANFTEAITEFLGDTTSLTADNFIKFYNQWLKENENIGDYSTFKAYYNLDNIKLRTFKDINWSNVIDQSTNRINWKELQLTIGEAVSNLIPQSFDSALKASLGLPANASDDDITAAISEDAYQANQELLQLKTQAAASSIIGNVISGTEDITDKERLAANLLGMSGGFGIAQIIPESFDELSQLKTSQLQERYEKLIKPLTKDYLEYSDNQLISQIQAAQIKQNVLGAASYFSSLFTDQDVKLMREYEGKGINELLTTISSGSEASQYVGQYYQYAAATAAKGLAETFLNSFSTDFLQEQFGDAFKWKQTSPYGPQQDLIFAEQFGKSIAEWIRAQDYSIEQTKELTNYIGQISSTFGQSSAEWALGSLTSTKGKLNTNTLRILQNLNLDTSLSGVASVKALKGTITDDILRKDLDEFYERVITDVGGENGLFAKLWNSSDFAKVAGALEVVYQETGKINASLVEQLTSKSSSLNSYLQASNLNAGGLAAIMSSMFRGTINIGDLTSGIIGAFGTAAGSTGSHAKRQQEIEDFEIEDSSANIINKKLKEMGSALTIGWNSGMLTDPAIMSIIEAMSDSTQQNYYEAINKGRANGWSSKQTLEYFRSHDKAFDTLYGRMTNKKNPATAADWANYIADSTGLFNLGSNELFYEQDGSYILNMSPEWWAENFGANGRYAGYGDYLKETHPEWVNVNGELDLKRLYSTSTGYEQLFQDYITGVVANKSGLNFDNVSYVSSPEGAELAKNAFTEYVASTGQSVDWEATQIWYGIQDLINQELVSEDVLRAFYDSFIKDNQNPKVLEIWERARNNPANAKLSDFEKFKLMMTDTASETTGKKMNILTDDYWENVLTPRDFASSLDLNYFTKQGLTSTFVDVNGIERENIIDFQKAYDYFVNTMQMTQEQAFEALNELAKSYEVGGNILQNGSLTYQKLKYWSGDIKDYYEQTRDATMSNIAKDFAANLFAGIKSSFGLENFDTSTIEKEITEYFSTLFKSEDQSGPKGIAGVIQQILGIDKITGFADTIKTSLSNLLNNTVEFFTGQTYDALKENEMSFPSILGQVMKGAFDDLKTGGRKLAIKLGKALGVDLNSTGKVDDRGIPLYDDTVDIWKNIFISLTDKVSGIASNILTGVNSAFGWKDTDFDQNGKMTVGEQFRSLGKQLLNRSFAGLAEMLDSVNVQKYFIDDYGNIFSDAQFKNQITLKDVFSDIWNSFTSRIEEVGTKINENIIPEVLRGDNLGQSLLNIGQNMIGWTLTGLNNLLAPDGKELKDIKPGKYKDSLKKITSNLLMNIGNIFDEGKYDIAGDQLVFKENQEVAKFSDVIGSILDGTIPAIAATVGNIFGSQNGEPGKQKYRSKNGKLEAWDTNTQDYQPIDWKVYYQDLYDNLGDNIQDIINTAIDNFTDAYKYNAETNQWVDKDEVQHKFSDVFANIFGLDDENSPIYKFISPITEAFQQIQHAPTKLKTWLYKQLEGIEFDEESKEYKNAEGEIVKLPQALGMFFTQTVDNFLQGIAPILTGVNGLGEDIWQSTGGFFGFIADNIKSKIDPIFQQWGLSIASALIPDDYEENILRAIMPDNFGLLDGLSVGLRTVLADIFDGLTNGSNFKYILGNTNAGFGDLIKAFFSKQGQDAFRQTIGDSFSNLMQGLGENLLTFLTKENYEWNDIAGGYIPKSTKGEIEPGSGKGFFGVLGGSVKDLFANMVAPQGYTAFNGQLYRDTDMTGGVPNEGAVGADPVTALIGNLITTLTGQDVTIGSDNKLYLGDSTTPFSLGNIFEGTQIGDVINLLTLGGRVHPQSPDDELLNPETVMEEAAAPENIIKTNVAGLKVLFDMVSELFGGSDSSAEITFDPEEEKKQELIQKIQNGETLTNADWALINGDEQLKGMANGRGYYSESSSTTFTPAERTATNLGATITSIEDDPIINGLNDWLKRNGTHNEYGEYSNPYYNTARQLRDDYTRFTYYMKPEEQLAYVQSAYEKVLSGNASQLSYFEKSVLQRFELVTDDLDPMGEFFTTAIDNGATTLEEALSGGKDEADEKTGQGEEKDKKEVEFNSPPSSSGGGNGDSGTGYDTGGGYHGTDKDKSPWGADGSYTDPKTGNRYVPTEGGGWARQDAPSQEDMDAADAAVEKPAASGQNNARLLAYASGKQGHIAITGELGPELRVKSDGSMDVLGKKGREYAWVEPDDRIYTAQQSAGILKSNKIPGLDALAKGINNYIPGYSISTGKGDDTIIIESGSNAGSAPTSTPSGAGASTAAQQGRLAARLGQGGRGGGGGGGGGGGSGIDPRYDPNTLKLRDVVERYYTILQKIDDITKAVERFSKVADRAWGQERIRALEQQNDMQRKQYEAQKKYINEIEGYLDADQQALITMVHEFVDAWNETAKTNKEIAAIDWAGAEFDENGNFTNYRDFVELLVDRFNTQGYYSNSQEQFKFQEQLKDIQFYTDSLNLYQEQRDALEDIKNSILDTAIQTITYEVEYKLQLSGNVERILNFQADKYKSDVYNAAKYLELLDQKADLTYQNLANVREGIFNIIGEYAGDSMARGTQHSLQELGIYPEFDRFKIPEELLQEITDKDEKDAEKLKKLQQEQGQKRTELIGTWIDQLYQESPEEAMEIEKLLKFAYDEKKAGKFEYDYNWRDTYSSWNDYYKEVINKTDDESIRALENYDTIVKKLNKVIDFAKVRTEVDKWLEELRIQDAKAAEEIDKMVQRDEEGNILNYTDVIYRINEANKLITEEAQKTLMEDEDAFFEWFSKALETSEFTNDLTNATIEQFSSYMDQEYSYLTSLRDYADKVLSSLSDQVKNFQKDMKTAVDEFDYYGAVYEEFGNIIDLTNRHMTDITKDFFDTLNSKVTDNAINKIKATATNYHLLEKQLADVSKQYETVQAQADAATGIQQEELQQYADKLKQELTAVNSQFEDAHKNFLSAWEDALNKLSEVYEKTLEEAGKNFEKAFSPMFTTFALLQAQFDRERALGDLYVDNYQRIHDLSKLNRDIENSIIDTDNLNGKERLRDLQKEINDLQEEGTELSEYDLDILDKKYQLELARQALEDAKDAKSMVRLARDNNGNWSYVYTANQDEVDKAEQDYEDAIQAMEQANEDYIKSLEDQVLQVRSKALQEMQSLNKDDFESIEAYEAAMRNIADSANKTMAYLSQQMNNAFGNNNYLLNPDIVDVKYGIQNHGLTTNTGDTLLGQLLGITDMGQISDGLANDLEDLLVKPSVEAYKKYVQDQTEIYNAAEHNMATIGKDFTDEMDTISNMSNDQVDVVNTVADRIQSKFAETVNFVEDFILTKLDNMLKRIRQYDQINQQLTKLIERSGENEPTEKIQFTGRVDSLADLQLLKKELTEHGILRVFEDMSGIDPDYIKSETEKMQEVTPLIEEWIEALKETTDQESKKILDEKLNIKKDANGNISNYYDVIGQLLGVKEDDKTKKTLSAIRKWQERDSKDTVLTDAEKANYVKGKGLWTTLSSDSDEAKAYFKRVLERIAYNQISVELAGDKATEAEASMIEYYIDTYGGVWVIGKNGEIFYDDKAKWRVWYEDHKQPTGGGGGGGGNAYSWGTQAFSKGDYDAGYQSSQWKTSSDTGGYTGRWQSAETGMYTGEWPSGSVRRNGRLAWLHQKELVLNAHDTENFLDAMEIVRQLDNLTNWMANGLGDLIMPNVNSESNELEQNVHIEAEFPNVTNHSEIEQAFNNLVNMASQYANRK